MMQQATFSAYFFRLLCAALFLLIVSTLSLGAQQVAPLSALDSASSSEGPFSKAQLEEMVGALGAASAKGRRAAHKRLADYLQIHHKAKALLWARYKSESDPEVKLRLREILLNSSSVWVFTQEAFKQEVWTFGSTVGGKHGFLGGKHGFLEANTVRIESVTDPKGAAWFELKLPAKNAQHRITVSFELKVEKPFFENALASGTMMTIEDDKHQAWAMFWTDHVSTYVSRKRVEHDFMTDFVPVRIELEGDSYRLFLDGKKVIDTPFSNASHAPRPRSWVRFGDGTAGSKGQSVWRKLTVELSPRAELK